MLDITDVNSGEIRRVNELKEVVNGRGTGCTTAVDHLPHQSSLCGASHRSESRI